MAEAGIRTTGIPAMVSTFSTAAVGAIICTTTTAAIGPDVGMNGIANIMANAAIMTVEVAATVAGITVTPVSMTARSPMATVEAEAPMQ